MSKDLASRLRAKKEELSQKGGKSDLFFLKEGKVRMRLVPVEEEEEWAVEATHFYLNATIKGVVSPITFGEPCAIMEAYEKLKNSSDEADREMAKKISPKKKYFALVYKYKDMKGKEPDVESGIRLLGLTNGLYQDLIDLYLDEDEAGDMTDEKTGYDIKFNRTGTGMLDTTYSATRCNTTKIAKVFKGKVHDPEAALKAITPTYETTQDYVEQVLGSSFATGKKKKKKSKDKDKKKKSKKK